MSTRDQWVWRSVIAGGWAALTLGFLAAGCTESTMGGPSGRATSAYAAGVLAYQRGDMPIAKQELSTATQDAPELIKARLLLGDLFRVEGDYKAAIDQYEVVVKLDPYSPGGFIKLGTAYQFMQRFLEAKAAYLKAINLKADDADSHMNLGLVYLALGDLPKAMEHTRRATELEPKNPAALANYGVVLDAVGDHVGAERTLLASLEIKGDSPATLLNLGQNLLSQNRGKEAQEVLERMLKANNSALARKRLGDAFALQGMSDEAVKQYEESLKLDPSYYPALNEAGRVAIQKYRAGLELDEKLREQALAYWRKSLTANAQQPQVQALVKQWEREKP